MFRRFLCLGMVLTAGTAAQVDADRPHWGVQGDSGYATVPQSIVGRFTESLPERPEITGMTFSVGLVRFHANGSPSFSFQYSQIGADLSGSITVGSRTSVVAGSGTIRGGLVTNHLNIITRRSVSAGFALGAGAGRGQLNYTRSVLGTTFSQAKQYAQVLPTFEALAQVDIRPLRYLSIAPYFGMRTGVMVVGAAVRVHMSVSKHPQTCNYPLASTATPSTPRIGIGDRLFAAEHRLSQKVSRGGWPWTRVRWPSGSMGSESQEGHSRCECRGSSIPPKRFGLVKLPELHSREARRDAMPLAGPEQGPGFEERR